MIAHFLRHQFFHIEDGGSTSMLETLQRPAARSLVTGYFDVAGYRLAVRESEGWAGILRTPSASAQLACASTRP